MNASPSPDTGGAFNLEAEMALLGAALCDPEATLRCVGPFRADCFSEPLHRRIWTEIAALASRGVDSSVLPLIGSRLDAFPAFEQMGGHGYLADLIDHAPPTASAKHYAAEITDTWAQRAMVDLMLDAIREAKEGRPTPDVLAGLQVNLQRIEAEASPAPSSFIGARDSALLMLAEKEADVAAGRIRGAETGLICFDRIGGLCANDLVILAGRPSMGKTALMRSAAYGAASLNPSRTFAIFSLEMTDAELSERAVASLTAGDITPLTTERLHKSQVELGEFPRLRGLAADRIPGNLTIDGRAAISLDDIRRAVWALKKTGDLAAVFVDYLQIMRRPARDGRADHAIIGEITSGLKALAKEAGICVVLLSQLSRNVESREDKRPLLSDLRESGSIEQDAVAVMFCYREAYYLERSEPKEDTPAHHDWQAQFYGCRRQMDVIIAKNRHGSIGTSTQRYEPEFDRITNWEDR